MDFTKEAHALLKKNRRITDGHQYTVPSSQTYPYQWFWDSCFHAIVLSSLEPEAAKDELRSLLVKQFANGMIPHIIYWQPGILHKYEWGKNGTSSITQPPMLAFAVWRIYEATQDKDFLTEMQSPLKAFYRYIIEERDRRRHHIISLINPDESGEDNSPRFDRALGISDPQITLAEHLKKRIALIDDNRTCNFDALHCMEKFFWVKDVPFNCILVENLKILADISHTVGDIETQKFAEQNRELVTGAMRKDMFADGVFWPTQDADYTKIRIDTWAHFTPLFAGLYTREEAEYVVKNHLLNKDSFCSLYGIRTVSKKEASYNPTGFWRGPIWSAVHWFVYHGLLRYGFTDEAHMIQEQMARLIEHEGFREYYDPETGKGLGAEDFTWGTLLVDMK
jgi:glycogen debranching enzyme